MGTDETNEKLTRRGEIRKLVKRLLTLGSTASIGTRNAAGAVPIYLVWWLLMRFGKTVHDPGKIFVGYLEHLEKGTSFFRPDLFNAGKVSKGDRMAQLLGLYGLSRRTWYEYKKILETGTAPTQYRLDTLRYLASVPSQGRALRSGASYAQFWYDFLQEWLPELHATLYDRNRPGQDQDRCVKLSPSKSRIQKSHSAWLICHTQGMCIFLAMLLKSIEDAVVSERWKVKVRPRSQVQATDVSTLNIITAMVNEFTLSLASHEVAVAEELHGRWEGYDSK